MAKKLKESMSAISRISTDGLTNNLDGIEGQEFNEPNTVDGQDIIDDEEIEYVDEEDVEEPVEDEREYVENDHMEDNIIDVSGYFTGDGDFSYEDSVPYEGHISSSNLMPVQNEFERSINQIGQTNQFIQSGEAGSTSPIVDVLNSIIAGGPNFQTKNERKEFLGALTTALIIKEGGSLSKKKADYLKTKFKMSDREQQDAFHYAKNAVGRLNKAALVTGELEEAKTGKVKVKSFNDVQKGDIGEDYSDDEVRIIAKGKGINDYNKILKRYDESGAMEEFFYDLEENPIALDWIDDSGNEGGYNVEDVEMVAVKFQDGSTAVYTYGDDGVLVYERKNVKGNLIQENDWDNDPDWLNDGSGPEDRYGHRQEVCPYCGIPKDEWLITRSGAECPDCGYKGGTTGIDRDDLEEAVALAGYVDGEDAPKVKRKMAPNTVLQQEEPEVYPTDNNMTNTELVCDSCGKKLEMFSGYGVIVDGWWCSECQDCVYDEHGHCIEEF